MKTVAAKLDNQTHREFVEMCNQDGVCVSERIREMVEGLIESERMPEQTARPAAESPAVAPAATPEPKIELIFD